MANTKESFNNLIDICIELEENPELTGKAPEMFRYLLTHYFFKSETYQSKNFDLFLNNLKLPDFLSEKKSLFEVAIDEIRPHIEGSMINDSLAGSIMLSQPYLKAFYTNHPPSFSKMPEDVRFELMDKIKQMNENIIAAFEKMSTDKDADKKRKVLTLIALMLKNICRRSGRPIGELGKSVEETIKSSFKYTDEVFIANQRQVAELGDDSKIKQLIKTFFPVRQFKEINEITDMYKKELARYRKRGMKSGTM